MSLLVLGCPNISKDVPNCIDLYAYVLVCTFHESTYQYIPVHTSTGILRYMTVHDGTTQYMTVHTSTYLYITVHECLRGYKQVHTGAYFDELI